NTVREFVELTFSELGIQLEWQGKEENEKGIISSITDVGYENKNVKVGDTVVIVSPTYYRPTEVELLVGDPSKARNDLGWKTETTLQELVKIMIKYDYKRVVKRGY
ncbi:MAG: GDP-mannose 4,6-dehydratase, partial [Salinivirgaceae bacterium]|nr:GDP-mannose 4,6-dehydratase [Salinivirgaceae bacterium]